MSAAFTPDGRKIIYIGQRLGRPEGSKSDLWVIDRAGGQSDCRTASLPSGVGGGLQRDAPSVGAVFGGARIVPTSDSRAACVQVQIGGTVGVYRVALTGRED